MACQKQIENFAAEKGYPNAFKWELAEWPFGDEHLSGGFPEMRDIVIICG